MYKNNINRENILHVLTEPAFALAKDIANIFLMKWITLMTY